MNHILKQAVGIDCSKDELVCCLGLLTVDLDITLTATTCVANTQPGIGALLKWVDKLVDASTSVVFVVEATGVYHQQLAYQLHRQGRHLSVVLPYRAAYFARTLKVRTVTDRSACQALARMGLEKKLDPWSPPQQIFSQLKQLTRERKRLKDQMTVLNNQQHAAQIATQTLPGHLQRLAQQLSLCHRHVRTIENEINDLIARNETLTRQFRYVCSIKGVGLMSAAVVVGETDGFARIRNVRQLVSYAGYDVVEKQSGSSVQGKPRISKKGNSYIRSALHFPALTAVRWDKGMELFFERLYSRHHIKMKAYTAVQRKLLVLIYTMWTKQVMYDPNYSTAKKVEHSQSRAPHELA